jgi:TRAP-type C4-dicarboxylate transport system permease small subunit
MMEELGVETENLMSNTAVNSVVNTEIIPELRLFLILTITAFGLIDGLFSYMLWKGNPKQENKAIVMPLYITYIFGSILSAVIISIITPFVLVTVDPRGLMNILYVTTLVFSGLAILIIILFQKKIFTARKRTAKKVLVRGSESTP